MLSVTALVVLSQVIPPGLGTQPGGLDGGEPFGSALNRCGQCHDRSIIEPGDPPLYMPFDGWVSSMMGNSVRDPLFLAALSVANQDVPGVGTWCLRCHSPQSYVRGHGEPPDGGAFDDLDNEGVTCDVCHRSIAAPDSGSPVIGNAQITFERRNVKHGPYPNVFSPAHEGTDGGVVGSSELCGQCHQVENPIVPWRDPDGGAVLGPRFPLDTTYDEWKQSQFASGPTAANCQDCHMPRVKNPDGGPIIELAVGKFASERRPNPRRHTLVGGNLWGLEAVQRNAPGHTGLLADQFQQTKAATEESLKSAAELSVTAPATAVAGDSMLVTVKVKNKTGHKLPTGYADGRRIVVQLLVNGRVHTGAFDAGTLIEDPWLKVYEILHGKFGVGVEEHLAKHDMIVKDSRIPPSGFRPPPGAATVPVPASLYANGSGGYLDYDEVTWDIQVPSDLADGAPLDVTARLLYQATTPHYVQFLKDENQSTDAGRNLFDIWKATGEAAPFEMARAEKRVTVRAGGTGGGAGGSGGQGGAGGGAAGAGAAGGSVGGGTSATGGGGSVAGECGKCSSGPGALLWAALLLAVRATRRRR